MFAKPYKLKSNNTLKNSEKKQLVQRITSEFPAVSEERVKELVPMKSTTSCMKVLVASGGTVSVYVVDGTPVMLDTELGLVPTVCALWAAPDLLPALIIHSPVLSKVAGGAPLYLPGVAVPAGGAGFPMFPRGALLAARTQDNAAAALVGRALMSSADMLLKAGGACLEALHVCGDLLCRDARLARLQRPQRGPALYCPGPVPASADPGHYDPAAAADSLAQLNIGSAREEWPVLGPRSPPAPRSPQASPPPSPPAPHAPRLLSTPPPHTPDSGDAVADLEDAIITEPSESEASIPPDMDGLLQWCLLTFLKLHAKNVELPLKTSLLYRNHLIPLCPPDRTLDVKKSTYKKMSKFLEAMQQEGLLEVREVEKGVDAVVAVHAAHPRVRAHAAPPREEPRPQAPAHAADYTPPAVREMLCVTAHVADLLAIKKGTALTPAEVRGALTDYVKSKNLAQQKGAVTLDVLLAKAVGKQEQELIKWDTLMSAVQSKMTPATEMRFEDGTLRLTKSKLEPITMQVVTRSGNKKVTLVSNLEAFGFALPALARACQGAAGASCGVTRSPAARCDQLMLQGDQTHFIAKLLIEKYGLPKKFVEGADKALNKKK